MKNEHDLRKKLDETLQNYQRDLHNGYLTRTKQIKYRSIIATLKYVLEIKSEV